MANKVTQIAKLALGISEQNFQKTAIVQHFDATLPVKQQRTANETLSKTVLNTVVMFAVYSTYSIYSFSRSGMMKEF